MASISSVVTMGFGNGTFVGDVNLLPTLGYGIGTIVTGTLCVCASGYFVPGAQASDGFVPGAQAAQGGCGC